MALTVLDAGVVIGVLDATDAHHEACLRALEAERASRASCVLPSSAYAETLVGPWRRGQAAVAILDAFVDALPAAVVPVDRAVARRAAELRARHAPRLRLPDALVVATGLELGADHVLTTDGRWPEVGITVRVVGACRDR